MICYHRRIASIILLLLHRNKSAILRAVVAVYVYAVKRLFFAALALVPSFRFSPFFESFKRIPFAADLDATTTIIIITLSMGISAPLPHANP